MTEAQALMRAVVGQGWLTLDQIAARLVWLDGHPTGSQIAPLALILAWRGWLVYDWRHGLWSEPRLARHHPL